MHARPVHTEHPETLCYKTPKLVFTLYLPIYHSAWKKEILAASIVLQYTIHVNRIVYNAWICIIYYKLLELEYTHQAISTTLLPMTPYCLMRVVIFGRTKQRCSKKTLLLIIIIYYIYLAENELQSRELSSRENFGARTTSNAHQLRLARILQTDYDMLFRIIETNGSLIGARVMTWRMYRGY